LNIQLEINDLKEIFQKTIQDEFFRVKKKIILKDKYDIDNAQLKRLGKQGFDWLYNKAVLIQRSEAERLKTRYIVLKANLKTYLDSFIIESGNQSKACRKLMLGKSAFYHSEKSEGLNRLINIFNRIQEYKK